MRKIKPAVEKLQFIADWHKFAKFVVVILLRKLHGWYIEIAL